MNNTNSFQFADATVPFVYDGRDRMVLPQQYSPGIDVVIIGRGKKVQQHPANIRFRALIQSQLENYSNAATKGLKSNILWRVLNEVRSYSASRLGFVKRDTETGRWYAIEDTSAKINISQAFRDGLNTYKSSKKHKQKKRKQSLDDEKNEGSQLETNMFSTLERFDNQLETSPQNKRVRVSLNQRITESSEPADHTIGRLGATMDRLRNFLSSQTAIPLETESNQLRMSLKESEKPDSWDTFSKLCNKFGSQNKVNEDPFEPMPLPSSAQTATAAVSAPATARANAHDQTASRRNYSWDEPESPRFAMAEMVERTNPPDPLSINSAIFDPVPCMQEAMLPSVLSLNTLALAESDALGMTSFSSLSDISDKQDLQDIWDVCRSKQRSTTTCSV
ncbi:Nitrilase family, member 2 [Seminavis robusta]|uniref:Nitrilase family, member 2 n=1 Tax=Seminavis robusta TaxID=568900 RepID=A0A9N8HWL6_9STRA|nr:Nitrilase family, member 2 [Seminavis robusta]|eukprot:Sro1667_g289830.1 Nitrilase family, member 2 (392) ;mRNA; r:17855-19124